MKLPIRYIARITVEAETPVAVGTGNGSLVCDKLVARGINGLPFIPGTSLAGVLRHSVEKDLGEIATNDIFGYQRKDKKGMEHADGEGSRLIITSAYFLGKENKVFEGLEIPNWEDPFYKMYKKLPVRQHVRLSHSGTAVKGGKFDEEVVYKGTRFIFDLELKGVPEDQPIWTSLLHQLAKHDFRIGAGTRKGFGKIKATEIITAQYDLNTALGRTEYANRSSSLAIKLVGKELSLPVTENNYIIHYKLELKSDDFFLFSSGLGSDQADINPVRECTIIWEKNEPRVTGEMTLIPGSSVKGAIVHRTAFHYNKIKGITAEKLANGDSINVLVKNGYFTVGVNTSFNSSKFEDRCKLATEYNPAVTELFGFSSDEGLKINDKSKSRGNVLISDVFLRQTEKNEKLLNHVSIDRFTGGVIDGALFSEMVSHTKDNVEMHFYVNESKIANPDAIIAMENALKDIASGSLPLGGGTMRGHGCFSGKLYKNEKELKNEQ